MLYVIVSTTLAKIAFSACGMMLASTAFDRVRSVMSALVRDVASEPEMPQGNRVEFKNVSFTYDGAAKLVP